MRWASMSGPFTPVKSKKRRAKQPKMALLSWVDKMERDSREVTANSAWIDDCLGQSVLRYSEPSA